LYRVILTGLKNQIGADMEQHNPTTTGAPKSSAQIVDDVMNQTQQALRSAARASEEVHELERRAQDALDWRKQLREHPWVPLGFAAGIAILVYAFASSRK
jgi:ElaB/YqjD/DUF883 family membrane-anchored ribosome-binding protein